MAYSKDEQRCEIVVSKNTFRNRHGDFSESAHHYKLDKNKTYTVSFDHKLHIWIAKEKEGEQNGDD